VIHRLQLYCIQCSFMSIQRMALACIAQVNGQKRIVTRLSRHCTETIFKPSGK